MNLNTSSAAEMNRLIYVAPVKQGLQCALDLFCGMVFLSVKRKGHLSLIVFHAHTSLDFQIIPGCIQLIGWSHGNEKNREAFFWCFFFGFI